MTPATAHAAARALRNSDHTRLRGTRIRAGQRAHSWRASRPYRPPITGCAPQAGVSWFGRGRTPRRRRRRRRSTGISAPPPSRGTLMKTWSKPQIREIPCGCEINSYSSGDLF
ncbi:pyrroloquinoline quinone precursor peptide PqqA [Lysobacter enzymogenes]|uniref:pyrroloquinoline quinone precursor peptide PqqA n=1 Tax=Lysobacter enzymogenes TaxID=69 RepID=UPI0037481EA1